MINTNMAGDNCTARLPVQETHKLSRAPVVGYGRGEGGRGCVPAKQVEVSRWNKVAAVWDLLFRARASAGDASSHSPKSEGISGIHHTSILSSTKNTSKH